MYVWIPYEMHEYTWDDGDDVAKTAVVDDDWRRKWTRGGDANKK